jgi:hypothetical protein
MHIDMTEMKPDKPKVIKANKSLQEKVGTGKIDDTVIEKCQTVMDNNDVDFTPLAMEYLDKLATAIKTAKTSDISMEEAVSNLTAPVMQLKANAATFKYSLIGNLANVMLSFLEGVQELDKDAISIVEAHHKTLTAIVIKKMTGTGGAFGAQMEDELKNACKRYFAKRG